MALPTIIHYDTVREGHTWPDIAAAYTCPNDGFIHAWQERTDQNFVWYLPACPVDSVVASLKIQIANFVNFYYNYATNVDKHEYAVEIEESVASQSRVWLENNTTEEIAGFLKVDEKLYPLIRAEMINQQVAQA